MKCATCPVEAGACLGESVSRLCDLARARDDYRRLLVRRAAEVPPDPQSARVELEGVLAAISACPHRGPVLPMSFQPECGCSELSECRAGEGAEPGRVTIQNCLSCMLGARRGRS